MAWIREALPLPFTNDLREAMFQEPVRFIEDVIQHDRPVARHAVRQIHVCESGCWRNSTGWICPTLKPGSAEARHPPKPAGGAWSSSCRSESLKVRSFSIRRITADTWLRRRRRG